MLKKRERAPINEEWITSYSDMVTLLLCFFIMMLSVSSLDASKYEKMRSGMTESLGGKETLRPMEMMQVELAEDIQSLEMDDDAMAIGSDSRGIVIDMDGEALFDYASAKIKPAMEPALKKIAATLDSERYKNFGLEIEGHTSDEKFSSPQFPSNWELSSARASALASFFESRGIPRRRMKVVGMSDISPKYPNMDPFGDPIPVNRKRNRRVSIHIEPVF